ncbi:MAG TPA: hypothetical protein PLO37_17530 [Candidatus Hydrogenedentes bacterium]|nr:hypothetical protein [Candidatus Hydrogenedentota bacterium]HPG68650.1 hypothetical protein [Candidatus Hydrogenedentota bacterium]
MSNPTRRSILKLGIVGAPAASLLANMLASAGDESSTVTTAEAALEAAKPIEKASVCFRIGQPIWSDEARFTELLDLFDAHRGVTDEVTLFTSETHPPLPLDVILERVPVLDARMQAARARGYRSGINVLATLGHHDENLANSLSGEYTPMTDPNGNICRGSLCPNDPRLQDYIRRVYEAVASVHPDYIWIDDDVRLFGHMPVGACCFCDTCVALFSKRSGTSFTRDSLRDALGAGTLDERLRLRRAFLQHNRDTISELFTLIETTVHKMAPGLPLGFMTGDRFYEGYGFDEWAEVLAGPSHSPVLWRPGGGAYREDCLDSFPDKAHAMGRQVALLPAHVRCIQSEVESFPYQRLKKSIHATSLEAAAYIAAGCTGTAFNVMSQYNEPLDEYAPLVGGLKEARPFLDLLARHLGRLAPTGIHSGWVKDTYAASNPDGAWFYGPGAPGHCNEIWATGLPAAYSAACAPVTALAGDIVLAFTDDEIRAALAKGVYLDGPALTRLNATGYGELTGFAVEKILHEDCIEEMTDHALNEAFAGRRRNGRQSFWKCPTYLFRATAAGAESISRCVDYTYTEVAPCCMGVFENALGGRVCVAGYYPWEQLQNLSKSSQLKSVMRWLSKDALAAYVSSFHRVNLWTRETAPGRYAIALLNAYLDPATSIEVRIRTEQDTLEFYDMMCARTTVRASGKQDVYTRFVLPTISPWEVALASV